MPVPRAGSAVVEGILDGVLGLEGNAGTMRQDYILRTLERLIRAIAQVILQREMGRPEAALHQVLLTLHHQLGLDISQLTGMGADEIHRRLTQGESLVVARDKCFAFAALNRQVGLIYLDRGATEMAQTAFHLALVFTLRGRLEYPAEDRPEFTPEFEELVGRLTGFDLPPETQRWLEMARAG
jgi:hypothetical protein